MRVVDATPPSPGGKKRSNEVTERLLMENTCGDTFTLMNLVARFVCLRCLPHYLRALWGWQAPPSEVQDPNVQE